MKKQRENVRVAYGQLLKSLRKSSERGRISSENRQNVAICRFFFCNEQNNTWLFLDMEFLVTRSRQSLAKYRVEHSKRNSTSKRVISVS